MNAKELNAHAILDIRVIPGNISEPAALQDKKDEIKCQNFSTDDTIIREMDSHPTEETILAYCHDRLDPSGVATVEYHLRDCGECCRRIVAIVKDSIAATQIGATQTVQ